MRHACLALVAKTGRRFIECLRALPGGFGSRFLAALGPCHRLITCRLLGCLLELFRPPLRRTARISISSSFVGVRCMHGSAPLWLQRLSRPALGGHLHNPPRNASTWPVLK